MVDIRLKYSNEAYSKSSFNEKYLVTSYAEGQLQLKMKPLLKGYLLKYLFPIKPYQIYVGKYVWLR